MDKNKLQENRNMPIGCLKKYSRAVLRFVSVPVLIAFLYLILRGAGAFLIVADELKPSQAIVVLSGGTETRMQEALNLYEDQIGDIIILTETGEEISGFDVLHSFDMRIQLMNNGVPSGNILVTSIEVSSTEDEAKATLDLLNRRQYTSAIIVTDPYHTRRTRIIFNDVFQGSGIDLIIKPVRGSWFNSRTWFFSIQGWQFTILEYLKLFGYKIGVKSI